MMQNKNIIFNHTLDEYNKKYRNRRHRLLKHNKKQVEDFDNKFGHYVYNNKKFNLEFNNYLLKDRKWVLIDDTYYEIPKPIRLSWFRNLKNSIQIATCGVFCLGIVSAVIFPIFASTIWNNKGESLDPTWAEKEDWYNRTKNATEKDLGKVVAATVNKKKLEIRLIGVDHDVDENGNKLHTTWEFANPICDENGDSIAYQWNDSRTDTVITSAANYDYTNSSIRYALNGTGNNCGKTGGQATEILAAVKGGTNFDNPYKDKKIIDMLPETLTKQMKTVKKTAVVKANKTANYEKTEFTDKLFLLSPSEMGYINADNDKLCDLAAYSFYVNAKGQTESIRIKKQINNDEVLTTSSVIKKTDSGTRTYDIDNHAGYNASLDDTGGSYYWLRAPHIEFGYNSWISLYNGKVNGSCCYRDAYPVAPAFCI